MYRFQAPKLFHAGYVKAGRVNTYAEIIPVDADGIATCHSLSGKAFLENHGFTRLPDMSEQAGASASAPAPEVMAGGASPRRGRPPRR